jgi:hypothetical protein
MVYYLQLHDVSNDLSAMVGKVKPWQPPQETPRWLDNGYVGSISTTSIARRPPLGGLLAIECDENTAGIPEALERH